MEAHDIYRVAVAAQIDPGTVRRFLKGVSVRGLSRLRIEAAMKRLGLKPQRKAAPRAHNETHETQTA